MPPEQYQPQQQIQPAQYQSYERPANRLPMGKIALVVGIFFLLLIIQWVVGHGYVEVTVDSRSGDDITYSLTHGANSVPSESVSSSKTYKKIVSKGNYEVLVEQAGQSYFASVDTKGFFGTTKVEAKLSPERGRQYVGNKPKSCLYWLGTSMISYDCKGSLGSFVTHVPAKPGIPTFAKPNPFPTEDVFEGLVRTKEGDVLLIFEAEVAGHEEFETEDGAHSPHVAFVMKDGLAFKFENRTLLTDLPEDRLVSIKSFKDGFLAYDEKFEKTLYYPSVMSAAENITTPRPKNESLVPFDITTGGSLFAISYNKNGSSSNTNVDSVVMVQDGDQSREYKFSRTFESIRLCGTKKLCGLSDEVMYVYDVSGDKADQVFAMNDVKVIETHQSGLAVVRSDSVVNVDVDKRQGSLQYSFGADYGFCGIQPAKDSYVVCIGLNVSGFSQQSLLFIQQDKESDNIDKKLFGVINNEEVLTASAYKNLIFVSIYAGEIKYIPSLGRFDYDPETLKKARSTASSAVEESGIDKSKYKVEYTY